MPALSPWSRPQRARRGRRGFPLARGWYRQLDVADNPTLYANHLDATAYRRWLRSETCPSS
jgi:hypothetical protein